MKIKDLKVGESFLTNGVPYTVKVYFKGSSAIVERLIPPYDREYMEEEVEVELQLALLRLKCGDIFSPFNGKVYEHQGLTENGFITAVQVSTGAAVEFNPYLQAAVYSRG